MLAPSSTTSRSRRVSMPDIVFCCQVDGQGRPVIESSGALVVGNPQLMPTIAHHWHLKEIPGAEYEARILGELLSCRPLIGPEATKGAVLHQIEQVGKCLGMLLSSDLVFFQNRNDYCSRVFWLCIFRA